MWNRLECPDPSTGALAAGATHGVFKGIGMSFLYQEMASSVNSPLNTFQDKRVLLKIIPECTEIVQKLFCIKTEGVLFVNVSAGTKRNQCHKDSFQLRS
jgi:hypothetical protein